MKTIDMATMIYSAMVTQHSYAVESLMETHKPVSFVVDPIMFIISYVLLWSVHFDLSVSSLAQEQRCDCLRTVLVMYP